jgi:uncharacterized protein YciI
MFIVTLKYKKELSVVEKYLERHIDFLKMCFEKGYFILAGRKDPRTGGFIISTLEDTDKLMEILKNDPFFTEELADFEITKVTPTRASKELEFLISK